MIAPRTLHLSVGAAALTLLIGLAGEARAGSYYGYATQETDTYTFSGAMVGLVSPLSSSSTASTGTPPGSEAHTGLLDVLQSYVGPGPRPAENTFTPVGMVNPDYSRGDALLTLTSSAFTTNNVAEGYFTGVGNAAGAGSWAVSAPITLSASGAVTLSFHYSNNLTLNITGPAAGSVAADFGYTFTIRDSTGAVVFTSSPTAINQNASLNAPGSIVDPGSGTISITSATLGAGSYTGSIQGTEHVFINSVPEPSSCILLGSGVVVTLGIALRFRRRPAA